jgi:hypothetical protein
VAKLEATIEKSQSLILNKSDIKRWYFKTKIIKNIKKTKNNN